MLIASLRGRLFVGLTVFTIGTALIAGYMAFRWAFDEAIELQDATLLQVGSLVAKSYLHIELPSEGNVDGAPKLLIEELKEPTPGDQRDSSHSSLPSDLRDGLQTTTWRGQQWRILVRTRDDGSRVAICQPTSNRDEVAQDSALRAIIPLGILIPCLMFLIAIVVDRSLRPLLMLANTLDTKQSDHLEKLSVEGIPTEIVPFVASINRLLDRLGTMFDKQRRFIASAAHELRTPLAVLIVQADNLERTSLSEDGHSRLQALKTGIRRSAHLLEQLLALAKYDSVASNDSLPTEFGRVVKGVVADLLPMARDKSIDLGFVRAETVSVCVEPVELAVLTRNLIDNALRHTPKGGHVDVSLFSEDGLAVLQIDDTGPGIPNADLDRLLEPFVRGNLPQGEGSGLGLSIVRNIVERCNGSISFNSALRSESSGLQVRVSIPMK